MTFLREHLISDHYNWSVEKGNHAVTNSPDRRFFDRSNGNQILYIINSFGYSVGKLTINDGQRIESLIIKELPPELKSEIAVLNWLKGKYLYYWN